jgi:hypothetical protein
MRVFVKVPVYRKGGGATLSQSTQVTINKNLDDQTNKKVNISFHIAVF